MVAARTLLVAAIALLTAADHVTTWLCLREPVQGWVVAEANPFAAWLFAQTGLVPGLLIDSLVTLAALVYLATTTRFAPALRTAMLGVVAVTTAYAVVNNAFAIAELGIGPFGA